MDVCHYRSDLSSRRIRDYLLDDSDVSPCQGQLDRIMRLVHENLLGVRVIRAFNREEKKFSRLEKILKR